MIDTDPDRAYYGLSHVSRANEEMAINTLLITDSLFRSSDVKTRRRYVDLVESVRENGGETLIFSALHVSGKQLEQVSGVAAILRYPLPDLDELEEEAEKSFHGEDEDAGDGEVDSDEDGDRRLKEDIEDMGL